MKKILVALLTVFTMVGFIGFNSTAYQIDDDISITNITSTSAYLDWSGVLDFVSNELSPGCTITSCNVSLGDTLISSSASTSSMQLNNLTSDTAHFVYIYVYYTDQWGENTYYYTFDYFETGGNSNINGSDTNGDGNNGNVTTDTNGGNSGNVTTDTNGGNSGNVTTTPSTNTTVTLSTPKVSKVEIVDGTVYVKAGNIDSNTQKLEWKIYDKKTGKCVKSDTSYNVADYIYGVNARKVYYAVCRAVGYDSNYNEVYSNWSSKKYFVTQPKITTKGNSKYIKKNSVLIKWKKVTGAKNYTVYAKKKSSSKWVKIKTTSKTSYKLTKIKGKKINLNKSDYNFRVVTNAKAGGKTIKSSNKEYYRAYIY